MLSIAAKTVTAGLSSRPQQSISQYKAALMQFNPTYGLKTTQKSSFCRTELKLAQRGGFLPESFDLTGTTVATAAAAAVDNAPAANADAGETPEHDIIVNVEPQQRSRRFSINGKAMARAGGAAGKVMFEAPFKAGKQAGGMLFKGLASCVMQPVKHILKRRSAPRPVNQAPPANEPQANIPTADKSEQQEMAVLQQPVVDEAAAKWGQWVDAVVQEMAVVNAPPARLTLDVRSHPIQLFEGDEEVSCEEMEVSWEYSAADEASWEAMEASWDEDETCL